MMMESHGGPVAAVIGTLNEKADALKAQLTRRQADARRTSAPRSPRPDRILATAARPPRQTAVASSARPG
jgi:hypothetical protein